MEYFTIGQFAKKVGLSPTSIVGHMKRGNIKTIYREVPCIPISELKRFLKIPTDHLGRRNIMEKKRDI